MVFGRPVLRSIAIVVFASLLFAIVPEGLAAAWAALLSPDEAGERGWTQGLIMCAKPLGFATGSVLVNRLLRPSAGSA